MLFLGNMFETESRRRFQVPLILLVLILLIIGITYLTIAESGESTPTVQPEQQVGNPPMQNTPPTLAVPYDPEWIEIGTRSKGDESRALPIPWNDLITKVTPENKQLMLAIDEQIARPPGSEVDGINPRRVWLGYLTHPEDNKKLTLYGFSNYRWSEQDPFLLSYWKAEVLLSEIMGLRPEDDRPINLP